MHDAFISEEWTKIFHHSLPIHARRLVLFFYMELLVSDDKEMVIMMCLARFGLCSYSTQVMVFKMVSSNNLDLTRRIPGFVSGRHKLLWFHY
jgi:hypothetical protein